MNLLLVEDDEALAFVTRRALERRGYKVYWYDSVDKARQQLSCLDLHAALLDLKVGNDTSLDLIADIKGVHTDLPIVLITGYGSIATAVQAMKLGAVNYLTKPCTIEQILAALNEQDGNPQPEPASVEPPSLRRLEWETIQKALDENNGNISATARQLKMHRRTLQRKLQKRPVSE